MYDELCPDDKRVDTVQQIAPEFGVTRPTIYRHLQPGKLTLNAATPHCLSTA